MMGLNASVSPHIIYLTQYVYTVYQIWFEVAYLCVLRGLVAISMQLVRLYHDFVEPEERIWMWAPLSVRRARKRIRMWCKSSNTAKELRRLKESSRDLHANFLVSIFRLLMTEFSMFLLFVVTVNRPTPDNHDSRVTSSNCDAHFTDQRRSSCLEQAQIYS